MGRLLINKKTCLYFSDGSSRLKKYFSLINNWLWLHRPIFSVVNNAFFWIGANDLATRNRWVWSSNGYRIYPYVNWMKDRPNGSGRCVGVSVDTQEWVDTVCEEKFAFFCEKSKSQFCAQMKHKFTI